MLVVDENLLIDNLYPEKIHNGLVIVIDNDEHLELLSKELEIIGKIKVDNDKKTHTENVGIIYLPKDNRKEFRIQHHTESVIYDTKRNTTLYRVMHSSEFIKQVGIEYLEKDLDKLINLLS